MLLKIEKEHTSPAWEWSIGNDGYEQYYARLSFAFFPRSARNLVAATPLP